MAADLSASGRARRRPNADDAFRLAVERYQACERIDMQDLAADLGVDRTTLFRWVGNRDKLTVDIMLALGQTMMDEVTAGARGRGGRRLAVLGGVVASRLIVADPFRTFLQREPERSLRLLTTKASPVQMQIVQRFEQMIREEAAGGWRPPLRPHDLAYIVVRIIESFVYADLITGEEPDPRKVQKALEALLR